MGGRARPRIARRAGLLAAGPGLGEALDIGLAQLAGIGQIIGRAGRLLRERTAGEPAQHLLQSRAAGEPRHAGDAMAPVVEIQGGHDGRPVAREIGGAEGAAGGFQLVRQTAGKLALIEVPRPGAGQAP